MSGTITRPMSAAAPLILHHDGFWVSPWDCTVWASLREKDLPFTASIAILREGMGLVGPIRDLSITGRAPTLQHGDFWLSESMAIAEYLEDLFPGPQYPRVFPEDPRQRARARQVMSWLRTELTPLRLARPSQGIFYPYPSPPPPLSGAARASADELIQVATRLGAGARGHVFDAWCVADADLAFTLMRLHGNGSQLPPELEAYVESNRQRPSVREFVEHRRPPHAPEPF